MGKQEVPTQGVLSRYVSILKEAGRGWGTYSGPPSCPYSPKCLEGRFSEVRLQDPGFVRVIPPVGARSRPPLARRTGAKR